MTRTRITGECCTIKTLFKMTLTKTCDMHCIDRNKPHRHIHIVLNTLHGRVELPGSGSQAGLLNAWRCGASRPPCYRKSTNLLTPSKCSGIKYNISS
jgi:hypothetical protein